MSRMPYPSLQPTQHIMWTPNDRIILVEKTPPPKIVGLVPKSQGVENHTRFSSNLGTRNKERRHSTKEKVKNVQNGHVGKDVEMEKTREGQRPLWVPVKDRKQVFEVEKRKQDETIPSGSIRAPRRQQVQEERLIHSAQNRQQIPQDNKQMCVPERKVEKPRHNQQQEQRKLSENRSKSEGNTNGHQNGLDDREKEECDRVVCWNGPYMNQKEEREILDNINNAFLTRRKLVYQEHLVKALEQEMAELEDEMDAADQRQSLNDINSRRWDKKLGELEGVRMSLEAARLSVTETEAKLEEALRLAKAASQRLKKDGREEPDWMKPWGCRMGWG